MQILWKGGPATAEQIREALAPKRVLKDSSVRTMLGRLEEKGYVKHKLEGKAFVCSGVEKPQSVAVRAVRQILDRFCDSSLEQLLGGVGGERSGAQLIAVREGLQKLGLTLEPRKGPVETIVVDHIERTPTEN